MVPDPRFRQGRCYSLTSNLLVCACEVVSGASTADVTVVADAHTGQVITMYPK